MYLNYSLLIVLCLQSQIEEVFFFLSKCHVVNCKEVCMLDGLRHIDDKSLLVVPQDVVPAEISQQSWYIRLMLTTMDT